MCIQGKSTTSLNHRTPQAAPIAGCCLSFHGLRRVVYAPQLERSDPAIDEPE